MNTSNKSNKKIYKTNLIKYDLYTDGACKGNPGIGGWGLIIIPNEDETKLSKICGAVNYTSNNRMELTAIVSALEFINKQQNVLKATIYSDSEYVIKGCTNWIKQWRINGKLDPNNSKCVKNCDIWNQINIYLNKYGKIIDFKWVKGHSDNKYNNMADKLANEAIKSCLQMK